MADVPARERHWNGTLNREWLYEGQLAIVGEVVNPTAATPTTRLYGYVPERHLPVLMVETTSGTSATYRIYGDHLGSLRAVVNTSTGGFTTSPTRRVADGLEVPRRMAAAVRHA